MSASAERRRAKRRSRSKDVIPHDVIQPKQPQRPTASKRVPAILQLVGERDVVGQAPSARRMPNQVASPPATA